MNIGKSVKKLVVNECACYDSSTKGIIYIKNIPQSITIKDYCDRERDKDCRCSIFKDKRCDYFERAVLPMNPQLEALYQAEHQAKEVEYRLTKKDKERIVEEKSPAAGKVKIHCKRCGKTFLADHYNQKYCESCKKYLTKKRWREQKQKERKRSLYSYKVRSETVDL
ncbi:hypothetical protein ES695_00790 [Candidatus Atribacteria bacterium 1244-E10-H5-B2]|nr:MAG: hypothetical protein ES695_00790 [Candidatus Atribacteria bacterium 1244-E10-H5-B2]